MRKKETADQHGNSSNAADNDSHNLLGGVADADGVKHPDWREQAEKVPNEYDEHADVEQVRAPHELTPPKELARSRLPRVLLPVEAQNAANHENGEAHVGIPAEHDVIDGVAHHECSDPDRLSPRGGQLI